MPNAVAYLDESTGSVWERTHGEHPSACVHILGKVRNGESADEQAN